MYNPKFAPSSAERWCNCPGSFFLYNKFAPIFPDKDSVYTAEGTTAHSVCEKALREALDIPLPEGEGYDTPTPITTEMEEYAKVYVSIIKRQVDKLKNAGRLKDIFIEHKFTYRELRNIPLGYNADGTVILENIPLHGTTDCAFTYTTDDDKLAAVIIDFKFGANKKVQAQDNLQLKLYAEAINAYYECGLKKVTMCIYQPRCVEGDESPLRQAVIEDVELELFDAEITRRINECLRQNEKHLSCNEGKWCQFCDMKGCCPLKQKATTDMFLPIVENNFKHGFPFSMTDEMIYDVIANEDNIKDFIAFIKNYAINRATVGSPVRGLKVSTTAGRRKWTNDSEAVESLLKAGVPVEKLYSHSLVGITEAKKLLVSSAKKDSQEAEFIIDSLTTKSPGSPKVVKDDDGITDINLSDIVQFKPIN